MPCVNNSPETSERTLALNHYPNISFVRYGCSTRFQNCKKVRRESKMAAVTRTDANKAETFIYLPEIYDGASWDHRSLSLHLKVTVTYLEVKSPVVLK